LGEASRGRNWDVAKKLEVGGGTQSSKNKEDRREKAQGSTGDCPKGKTKKGGGAGRWLWDTELRSTERNNQQLQRGVPRHTVSRKVRGLRHAILEAEQQ